MKEYLGNHPIFGVSDEGESEDILHSRQQDAWRVREDVALTRAVGGGVFTISLLLLPVAKNGDEPVLQKGPS